MHALFLFRLTGDGQKPHGRFEFEWVRWKQKRGANASESASNRTQPTGRYKKIQN